jgi:mRNA interferase MazF
VLATLTRNDLILCLITSQTTNDPDIVALLNEDFATGSLNKSSYAKPNRVFTANEQIIAYKVGTLTTKKSTKSLQG